MSRENSALIALEELKNLEARRVQQVHDEARAKEDAERRAREEAERIRREEEERMRREEEERQRREQEEREQREREERIRVAEAEARSRAEQEARLREEQMRLDAQVKMAERKKTPYWLYATAGVLAIGLVVGGYALYQNKKENEAIALQKKLDDEKHAAEIAAKEQALKEAEALNKKLQEESEALATKQKELAEKLANATDENERAKLLAEQAKLEEEQNAVKKKISANKRPDAGSGGDKKPQVTKERKDKLTLIGGDGPLD